MKTSVAVITLGLFAGGCASDGGFEQTNAQPAAPNAAAPKSNGCSLAEAILGGCRKTTEERLAEIYGPPKPTTPGTPARFTRWDAVQQGELTEASALSGETLRYRGTPIISSVTLESQASGGISTVSWVGGQTGGPFGGQGDYENRLWTLGPGIQVSRWDAQPGQDQTPFASTSSTDLLVWGYSAVPGWSYQTFGVWNTTTTGGGAVLPSTVGAVTPASAVPASGAATFKGVLAGMHVSPAGEGSIAAADLTVNANFSSRSLTFSSTGTRLTRDLSTATAAPNLDLSGTLKYAPATNRFSGTLTNAGGTMGGASTGRFYGPAAQELGGVFTVKSAGTVETFTGAYGAKR